jgi:hypothetical protein
MCTYPALVGSVNHSTGLLGPFYYLASEPHLAPSASKVDHGARHVRIAVLIQRHGVALSQAKNLGYGLGVYEVVDINLPSHTPSAYKR